jgi:GNAT superfamily N-acetyltransferase
MVHFELCGYIPGAIGRVAELHASYYHQSWGFGLFFEAKVATELSDFLLRFNEKRDGFWTVCVNERVEGSVAIDGAGAEKGGAHLRWLILSDDARGKGLGHRLLDEAVSFCKKKGYKKVYLWSFEGLHAARHLYEKFGFRVTEQLEGSQWGTQVLEQKFELELG